MSIPLGFSNLHLQIKYAFLEDEDPLKVTTVTML